MDGAEWSPESTTESMQNYTAPLQTFMRLKGKSLFQVVKPTLFPRYFWQKCLNRLNSANLMPLQSLLRTIPVL